MKKEKNSGSHTVLISTHVDPDVVARLDKVAADRMLSRSALMRRLINLGLPFEEQSGQELETVTQAVLHQIFPGVVPDVGDMKGRKNVSAKQTRTRKKPPSAR